MTLTRDSSTFKSDFLNQFCRIYKIGDQIYELNYREIKSKIGDKLRDQKYNFAKNLNYKN